MGFQYFYRLNYYSKSIYRLNLIRNLCILFNYKRTSGHLCTKSERPKLCYYMYMNSGRIVSRSNSLTPCGRQKYLWKSFSALYHCFIACSMLDLCFEYPGTTASFYEIGNEPIRCKLILNISQKLLAHTL